MENHQRIPVVFTPDENFIIPTCVAILSMLESKHESTDYYFYVIISDSIKEYANNYLKEILHIKKDFQYEIICINTSLFDQLMINTKHLSTSAYHRLLLPEILKDEKKIMYHDGDILVLDDLSEMYNVDISNYCVAGIPSPYVIQEDERKRIRIDRWGFDSLDGYIFSGDMIMNLERMREDGLVERFVNHMQLGYPSEDQDVINRCCGGKIKHLKLRYCMLSRWVDNDTINKFNINPYSAEEIEEAKKAPAIIHYAGADTKPWVNTRTSYGKVWWGFIKQLLDIEEYEQRRHDAERVTESRDWSFYQDELIKLHEKDIVIYGTGTAGKDLYRALVHNNYSATAFIDKNANNIDKTIDGVPVYLPENDKVNKNESLVFVTVQGEWDNIINYLAGLEYKRDNIIKYYYKGEFYYQSIDKDYRLTERRDYMDRTGDDDINI